MFALSVSGKLNREGERDSVTMMTPKQQSQPDRRHADRFPIQREVRYRVLSKRSGDDAGEGTTLNMSSSGILFTSDRVLLPGRRLEVSVSWPAQLNQKWVVQAIPLRLVARGRIVRYEEGVAAMEIQQYEFRISQAAGSITRAVRAVDHPGTYFRMHAGLWHQLVARGRQLPQVLY